MGGEFHGQISLGNLLEFNKIKVVSLEILFRVLNVLSDSSREI